MNENDLCQGRWLVLHFPTQLNGQIREEKVILMLLIHQVME